MHRSECGNGIATVGYPHVETQLHHRPVTGRLWVVRIGGCRGSGDIWEVRVLKRDVLGYLACGTLAGIAVCIHTAILISDLLEVDLTFWLATMLNGRVTRHPLTTSSR